MALSEKPTQPELTPTPPSDQIQIDAVKRYEYMDDFDRKFEFTKTEYEAFYKRLDLHPHLRSNYSQLKNNPVNSKLIIGQVLSTIQQKIVDSLIHSLGSNVIKSDGDLIKLQFLVFGRPWINKDEQFNVVRDLVEFANFDLAMSLQIVSVVTGLENEDHKFHNLSLLAKLLHRYLNNILVEDAPVNFFDEKDENIDILIQLLQLGFSFEFSKFVICEIRDKPASEKTLIINALNSICTTNKLSPSSKLDLCKLIGKETWFKPDYLPRFYENIDKFCDLLKLFEKETTHDLFYVAAFIICETRNEQEPLKILIFDAVEFILTTDKLTSDQKKTIFVDFVYKQNSWFKVDRLPEFLKMVCDYRPENGFLNLLDAARDRFTPDKKRENVSQPTELDEQSKLKPDATFLSAPVDMSKNEEVRSEGVLMQLIPQLYLTDPEVRFARMHLCQSTSSSSSQLFSHKGYFCEKLKGYELNKHQKRLISLCASDYKQPGIDVSSLVRGRPWIDSQQQVNVLEKMLKDSIWLKEALEILFKIEELSKVGEREFDKEELNNQLINFETLRNKFYPYQIKQIFLDLDTTSDSSIKLSKGYIEMLCAFIKADCTPDFVLQKAEEITDNPEANKIYEALAFLMRKPEGEEIFRDLVHKSWFDVEHLIQLKDIIDNGAELKNAVNQLEQSVLAELSQAPKV